MTAARWFWTAATLQGLLAAALCFVPLFDLLGYELAFAVGLLAALTGLLIGLSAGRDAVTPLRGYFTALALAAAHLGVPLAVISLNGLRVPNCNYGAGLGFFVALPLFTALYAAAMGAVAARLLRRRRRALRALVAGSLLAVPLAWSLWALYRQPPIFVFDHLWGHFAGSLYDEVITLERRLLVFRLGTLLRVAALGLLLWAWQRRARLGTPAVAAVALALAAGLTLFEVELGPAFGFRVTRADVERALPVTVERPGLVVHLPRGTSDSAAAELADEHAFRLEQLTRKLGVELPWTVHSFVYADAAQKEQLMGGRTTMVSKPWLHEIHIHPVTSPHPILAHELAHVVAATFGAPPLHLSARRGVLVNMGLVEGLAEAVTTERGALGLDQWTRAMRQLGVAPDMRTILGPAGFWTQAAGRAYTVAGSFVRHLLDQYGAERLRAVYRDGDFEAAYGRDLDALVGEWEARIDTLPLDPMELRAAQARFRTGSIFARTCAHEVARLQRLAAESRGFEAVELYRQVAGHLGETPATRLDVARALGDAGAEREFLDLSLRLLEDGGLDAVQRSDLLEQRGMTLWKRGELQRARETFRAALDLAASPDAQRLQWVRLWALDRPEPLSATMRGMLAGELPALAAAVALTRAAIREPDDPIPPYLVARQLGRVGDYQGALAELERSAAECFSPIDAERLRLEAEWLHSLGRLDEAAAAFGAYAEKAPTSGERARALDWLERVEWQRRRARGATARNRLPGEPED